MLWIFGRRTDRFFFKTCRNLRLSFPTKARTRPFQPRGSDSISKPAAPNPTPRRPLAIFSRCSLFTIAMVSGVSVGTVIAEYELWRDKALRSRVGSASDKPRAAHLVRRVFDMCESALGRPLKPTDIYWVIVAINLLVFAVHHSPMGPKIFNYFGNSPYSPTPALSMLLSVFTHHRLWHLAINMYVLHSFTHTLITLIGPGEYLTLFIGGGVFASFLSVFGKLAHRYTVPSVGSSGGICAILAAFCMLQPDSRLCIPFVVEIVPHSFQAHQACWVLLGIEFIGSMIFFGRSPIDHAAHLGGLLFGMYYSIGGIDGIWKRRNAIIASWTEWRGRR